MRTVERLWRRQNLDRDGSFHGADHGLDHRSDHGLDQRSEHGWKKNSFDQ